MSGDVVIVKAVPPTLKVVTEAAPKVIKVSSPGPQGPPGPAGSTIGGYGFNISGLNSGDILSFNGSAWYNRDDTDVTDGGNF